MNYVGMNKRFLCIIALVVVACSILMVVHPTIAKAAGEVNFDNTDVLEDLSSSTINGEAFNILAYPFDESLDIKIINFVEYCYYRDFSFYIQNNKQPSKQREANLKV